MQYKINDEFGRLEINTNRSPTGSTLTDGHFPSDLTIGTDLKLVLHMQSCTFKGATNKEVEFGYQLGLDCTKTVHIFSVEMATWNLTSDNNSTFDA